MVAKKSVQRLGFKTGEYIVYPAHGVGMITSIDEQEVAASRDPFDLLPGERSQLRGCSAHGERTRGLDAPNRPSTECGMERFGDDGEVGELGHGRDCSREKRCARLSRPREAGQLKKRSSGHSNAKERTAGTTGPRTT